MKGREMDRAWRWIKRELKLMFTGHNGTKTIRRVQVETDEASKSFTNLEAIKETKA